MEKLIWRSLFHPYWSCGSPPGWLVHSMVVFVDFATPNTHFLARENKQNWSRKSNSLVWKIKEGKFQPFGSAEHKDKPLVAFRIPWNLALLSQDWWAKDIYYGQIVWANECESCQGAATANKATTTAPNIWNSWHTSARIKQLPSSLKHKTIQRASEFQSSQLPYGDFCQNPIPL